MSLRVALFITPLADEFLPRVGVAIVKLLERHGCAVSFPAGQTSAGDALIAGGYASEAAAVARRFVTTFESFDYVVTPSASVAATVRHAYPTLLAGDAACAAGAIALAGKTFEFVEFLLGVLKVSAKDLVLPTPAKVAYQPTCYQRALGGRDETPGLLKRLGGATIIPLDKADQCCGFGGTFALNFPAVSGALAQDKARAVAASGAAVTVCNEPGCALTLAGACHRADVKTDVKHVADLMAEALGIDTESL